MDILKRKMEVNVNFFLRGKMTAGPDAMCAIYAVIDVDGQKCSAFSTKLKVPNKYWLAKEDKRNKIKASSPEYPVSSSYSLAEKFNDSINSLQRKVQNARNLLESMESVITPDAVKDLVLASRPVKIRKKIIDVVDELRDSISAMGRTENTMKNYRTRRNNLEEYLLKTGSHKLHIDTFRFRHFEEFQLWMYDQLNKDGSRRFCRNTINKHMTLVNMVLEYGVNKEYIKYNPLGKLWLEYDKTKPPQYLLPDARKRIFNCNLSTLETERDVAVFLFCTGLSYTDYLSLKDEHLYRLPSGEWFIKKPRDKSEIFSIIPLLEDAHDVINKYKCIENLPRPDISDLNKTLKILGEYCSSPYSLSTSTFRETFSSMMENEYMIPDRLLMFMMGHSNPRQLNNYSAVMPARILHELKKNKIVIPFNIDTFEQLVKAS